MRSCVLNIGVAIIALSGLPSCATDSANEVSEVGLAENLAAPSEQAPSEQASEPSADVHASDVKGTEESFSNENVLNNFIEDNAITPKCSVSWDTYSDRHCYWVHNDCGFIVHVQAVKYNGATTGCFSVPPGGTLYDCLATGRVWYVQFC